MALRIVCPDMAQCKTVWNIHDAIRQPRLNREEHVVLELTNIMAPANGLYKPVKAINTL